MEDFARSFVESRLVGGDFVNIEGEWGLKGERGGTCKVERWVEVCGEAIGWGMLVCAMLSKLKQLLVELDVVS